MVPWTHQDWSLISEPGLSPATSGYGKKDKEGLPTSRSKILVTSQEVMLVLIKICCVLFTPWENNGAHLKGVAKRIIISDPSAADSVCDGHEPWEIWQLLQDCQQYFLHHQLLGLPGKLIHECFLVRIRGTLAFQIVFFQWCNSIWALSIFYFQWFIACLSSW